MKASFITIPLLALLVCACLFFCYKQERRDYEAALPKTAVNEVTNTQALEVEMPTAKRESVKIEWTRPDQPPSVEAVPTKDSGSEGESTEVVALRAEGQALRA